MSALVLTLKAPPCQRLDLSSLTPERLRGRAADEIARIELTAGNRRIAVGEMFDIAAGDAGEIVLRDACARLDFIGRGMREGSIRVEGDAGACLGQAMAGGRISLAGNAGPWAATGMQGGRIEIGGNAGDFLGGALPGAMRGMSGGTVAVAGDAGARAGDRMRRGIIAIQGGAGDHAGSRMIAGTLLVLGRAAGAYPGLGMKRGTLLLRELPPRLLPTFADCGTHELGFLRLLAGALAGAGVSSAMLRELGPRVRRLVGDAATGGKGEILLWQP